MITAHESSQNPSGVTPATPSLPPFSLPIEPGTVIAGKYRIEKLIGTGGVGFVVEATHVALEDSVALKFLKPEFAGHQEAVTRFTFEARASFKIKNEHVARVLDVDTLPDGTPFMVMELLEGRDLRSILEQHKTLPVDLAVDFALQTCEALAAAHACHIVHRDIKPENLFVTQSGEDDHIKVVDFGISKVALTQQVMPARKTRATALTMMAVGTPPYMSPEQVRASNTLDARADQWSLGCVLYELLTGNAPFERMSLMQACAAVLEEDPLPLRESCPDASPELEAAVMRCLRKDPAQRFGDVSELARALAPFGARYVHCAERSVELLAEGLRRSEPGYRQSEPPGLRRADSLGLRISTPGNAPIKPVQQVEAKQPSLRFVPPPNPSATGNALAPLPVVPLPVAPVEPIPALRSSEISDADLDSAPSPLTEADLLEAEEISSSLVVAKPRKNRWIVVAVAALTTLSITYLAMRRSDSDETRSEGITATHTITATPPDTTTPSEPATATAPLDVPTPNLAPSTLTPQPEAATMAPGIAPSVPSGIAEPPRATPTRKTSLESKKSSSTSRKTSKSTSRASEDPDVGF